MAGRTSLQQLAAAADALGLRSAEAPTVIAAWVTLCQEEFSQASLQTRLERLEGDVSRSCAAAEAELQQLRSVFAEAEGGVASRARQAQARA